MTLARDALVRSVCARLNDARRTHDELRVIDDVLSGLEHGAETIGPLDLERDERDFGEEGAQECRDLLAYLAMQRVAEAHRRREWFAASDAPSAPDAEGRFDSGASDDGTRPIPPRTNGESRRAEIPSLTRTTALPVAARDTGAFGTNPVPPTVSSGIAPAASGARTFHHHRHLGLEALDVDSVKRLRKAEQSAPSSTVGPESGAETVGGGDLSTVDAGGALIARCPRCNGWTMFHGTQNSDTARQWAAQCKKHGDVVGIEHEPIKHWQACVESNRDAQYRTCAPDPASRPSPIERGLAELANKAGE